VLDPERHYGHFAQFGNREYFRGGGSDRTGPHVLPGVSAYNQGSGMKTLRLTDAGRLG
jgi:hypothetical protein